ncbi:hypothetical protein Tco_0479306 [Tanacetum coccineum]
MEYCDPVGTLMEIKYKLDHDQNGSRFEAMKYCSMIGTLMYLTSSRPDIVHATCLGARSWYTEDFGFKLTGFSDADYAGCKDTFKSISGGAQFLGEKLVSWSSKKQECIALSTAEAKYVSLSACCAQNQRDLPRNNPLDRVEVLGLIEKRSEVRIGIMPTEAELALEQSKQVVSHEVSVSIEGVEE